MDGKVKNKPSSGTFHAVEESVLGLEKYLLEVVLIASPLGTKESTQRLIRSIWTFADVIVYFVILIALIKHAAAQKVHRRLESDPHAM